MVLLFDNDKWFGYVFTNQLVKMNNSKPKRLNLNKKINITKTKKSENLSVRILAKRFCISKSQVNLNI
jgi:hypothetical protein